MLFNYLQSPATLLEKLSSNLPTVSVGDSEKTIGEMLQELTAVTMFGEANAETSNSEMRTVQEKNEKDSFMNDAEEILRQ